MATRVDVAKVREAAEAERANIEQFMVDVVSIPSLSCREEQVIRRIEQEMCEAGFDEVFIDRMGNCIGRIGNGRTKILMDAHIDTVGVSDPTAWERPPYPATLEDGVVYGRGAADQKGGIVGLVYGGKLIHKLDLTGDYTLYVTATCQEEDCDGLPLMHIIEKEGIRPDYCVLTDSTDMNLYRGQRGRMEIRITVKGVSCHGSAPERGDNAVTKASAIVLEIDQLNHRLHRDEFLGKGTVCVSKIECKTPSLCAVPDEATIYLDRRVTEGETQESALEQVRTLPGVQAAEATVELLHYRATAWTGLEVEQEKYFPTWQLPADHMLVRAGAEAASAALGKPAKVDRWVFSTNGVACAGRLGIPSIGFGPGAEAVAHTAREFCRVDDIVTSAVFYAILPDGITNSECF